MLLCQRKSNQFFITLKLGCCCKAVSPATAVQNRTCSFATNWQFFHLFIHLFDVHCSLIFASLRNSFSLRYFYVRFSFLLRLASLFECVECERWWCITTISISNSYIFFDNRTKSNGPDCWIVNKCFLLNESQITWTIILNAIFVLQLCIGWRYGWVLVCGFVCIRKRI